MWKCYVRATVIIIGHENACIHDENVIHDVLRLFGSVLVVTQSNGKSIICYAAHDPRSSSFKRLWQWTSTALQCERYLHIDFPFHCISLSSMTINLFFSCGFRSRYLFCGFSVLIETWDIFFKCVEELLTNLSLTGLISSNFLIF